MATPQPIQRSHGGFPEGFQYNDAVLSLDQEQTLVDEFAYLPFREFEFRGFLGKRRTVSFGWRYDFNVRELQEAEEIPTFLLGLRETVAKFAGLPADRTPTRARNRVLARRSDRLAQRPSRVQRRNWHIAACPLRVSAEAEDGATLGARVISAPASFRIPPSWCRAG